MKKPIYKKGAAVLIVVLFFVVLSVTILIGISMPITQQIENSSDFLASKKTYNVADMQAENALYRLNKGKTDAPSTLSVLGSTATGVFTDVGDEKQISIQGLFGEFERYVQARFKPDTGVSFNYGLQTGDGGLQMEGSSYISGNVYSNGDISGNGGPGWSTTQITGNAISATLSNPTAAIQNYVASNTTYSQVIGTTNAQQDFAQSFVMPTGNISEIQLYIKKTGSPANATLKIVNNNAGTPGATVLTSSVISASLVTSVYSNVRVIIPPATLTPGVLYWIVLDIPSNSTVNYYTIGLNNTVYATGTSKKGLYGSTWTSTSPATTDAGFSVYIGGETGKITNMKVGFFGIGEAWAREIDNTITGTVYCQIGTGNSSACNTSRSDPLPSSMPISSGNIEEWKDTASTGGSTSTVTVDGSKTMTLGPIKINGNLKVEASGKLYLKGPIYVTGTVTVSGNGKIYVDSSMGAASGLIISDDVVLIEGSGGIYGSGAVGSYVVVATTSSCPNSPSCPSGSAYAVKISGAAGSVVVVALDGSVQLEGSVSIKSLVANSVKMSGTSNIVYESGLADLSFTSGPSGTWTVSSWKEVSGL
jgi:hypothetical protein